MQYQSTAVVPLAFRTVETKAAAFTDLLFSADPLIECDALFDKEYGEGARFITRQIDHAIEGNRMRSMLPAVLRDAFSDGIKWIRPVWRKMARRVWVNSGPDDVSKWNEAILNASAAMTREGDTSTVVSCQAVTRDGQAVAGKDYKAVDQKVEFAAGETSKVVTIEIVDDDLYERDETFQFILQDPSEGALMPAKTDDGRDWSTLYTGSCDWSTL